MSTLGAYLAACGFPVVDTPVLGRAATWDRVRWIVDHHTVSPCDATDAPRMAHYLKTAAGRYPPLCQLFLDQSGRVWVISQQRGGQAEPGRASHMGTGSHPGIPTDRGNETALGIEVQCTGAHPLATHPTMYAALIRLNAALCRRYGLGPDRVIGHKEYNPGKVDPRDDMRVIRAHTAAALAGSPTTPGGDDDMTPEQDSMLRAVHAAIFTGGASTPRNMSLLQLAAGQFPVIRAVDGTERLIPTIQEIADAKTLAMQISARLDAVEKALATVQAGGLDASEVADLVLEGLEAALVKRAG